MVTSIERIGGLAVERAAPIPMRADVCAGYLLRSMPGLRWRLGLAWPRRHSIEMCPYALRHCHFDKMRRVAPGVKMQRIMLPKADRSRAFLLWSAPGVKM